MLHAEGLEGLLPDLRHITGRKLLEIHKDLFKTVVSSEAARVTPFELKVNPKGWHQPKHRTRPRNMSHSSEMEFRRQIDLFFHLESLE